MNDAANRTRGLTLVEVLISAALLAVLASACVPVVARAMSLIAHAQPSSTQWKEATSFRLELADVADRLMTEPQAFGLDELPEAGDFSVPWPDHPERGLIRIRVLESSSGEKDPKDEWLVIEGSDGSTAVIVHRWRPPRQEPASTTALGGPY